MGIWNSFVSSMKQDGRPNAPTQTRAYTGTTQPFPASEDYSALRSLGKLLSGIGWFYAIAGILFAMVGLASGLGALVFLPAGLGLAAVGFLLAALGQLITCFVGIARNTKASAMTLEQILVRINDGGSLGEPAAPTE